jgi:hypothetical protein
MYLYISIDTFISAGGGQEIVNNIFIYIYIYIYMHICINMNIYIHTYMYKHEHIHMYTYYLIREGILLSVEPGQGRVDNSRIMYTLPSL